MPGVLKEMARTVTVRKPTRRDAVGKAARALIGSDHEVTFRLL